MDEMRTQLANNLNEVNQRISAAASRSGRRADDITLVAVTKYVDSATTGLLIDAGCRDIGENRPQVLWEKASELSSDEYRDVSWHLIGHLQRNKVDRTLPLCKLIHSVDSLRLLKAINDSAAKQNIDAVAILLEVNTSGDASKHGWSPNEMAGVVASVADLGHIHVKGLMTMGALGSAGESARRFFATLRELRDRLSTDLPDNVSMSELSMGMTGDFEVAIEEGATLVRVGSALFSGCQTNRL